MRQLKFRAWDKNRKLWAFDIGVSTCFPHDWRDINDIPTLTLQAPTWDIQQYTGQNDINGRDIYEGDILQIYDFTDRPVRVSKVTYNASSMRYNGIPLTYSCEVIGNIYENAELLQ